MKKTSLTSVATCFVLCFSTTPLPADEQRLDVCDVSFLIPPSARSIRIAGGEGQKPLLSREVFLNFVDFIERGHSQMTADEVYENLVVTGIRFDPCGPKYPANWDLQQCALPNLRVIAQVYRHGSTANAALHMVFLLRPPSDLKLIDGNLQPTVALDPKMRDGVICRLALMKSRNADAGISTDGVPAGIHPVFGHANRNSSRVPAFEAELKILLNEYCVEDRYFFTAVMFTDEEFGASNCRQERWVWQKGNVDRSSGTIAIKFGGIAGFDPALKEQSFTADRERRGGAVLSPPSTLEDRGIRNSAIEAILQEGGKMRISCVEAAVNATDRLENPDLSLVQTDDCVSCHVTTTASEYAGQLFPVGARGLQYHFQADPRLTSVLDDAQYLLQRSNGYRVMSFAFFDGLPSVSQRTVNESLQAAHVANLMRN